MRCRSATRRLRPADQDVEPLAARVGRAGQNHSAWVDSNDQPLATKLVGSERSRAMPGPLAWHGPWPPTGAVGARQVGASLRLRSPLVGCQASSPTRQGGARRRGLATDQPGRQAAADRHRRLWAMVMPGGDGRPAWTATCNGWWPAPVADRRKGSVSHGPVQRLAATRDRRRHGVGGWPLRRRRAGSTTAATRLAARRLSHYDHETAQKLRLPARLFRPEAKLILG